MHQQSRYRAILIDTTGIPCEHMLSHEALLRRVIEAWRRAGLKVGLMSQDRTALRIVEGGLEHVRLDVVLWVDEVSKKRERLDLIDEALRALDLPVSEVALIYGENQEGREELSEMSGAICADVSELPTLDFGRAA